MSSVENILNRSYPRFASTNTTTTAFVTIDGGVSACLKIQIVKFTNFLVLSEFLL